jgi:hypothetical protein
MLSSHNATEILTEHKVIQEMINSEQTYNQTLTFLQEILSKEDLVKNSQALIGFKTIVPQLKVISDKLLDNVKKAIQPEIDPRERNILKIQRSQLLDAFFNAYPLCSNLYINICQEEKANPELFKEINNLVSPNNPSALLRYLIQLIQRGPRYKLLVENAISYNAKLKDDNEAKLSAEKVSALEILLGKIKNVLDKANSLVEKIDEKVVKKPYQFGDITKATITAVANYFHQDEQLKPAETEVTGSKNGYRFGDYSCSLSRGIYNTLWGATSLSKPDKMEENSSKESDIHTKEENPGASSYK